MRFSSNSTIQLYICGCLFLVELIEAERNSLLGLMPHPGVLAPLDFLGYRALRQTLEALGIPKDHNAKEKRCVFDYRAVLIRHHIHPEICVRILKHHGKIIC